MHLWGWQIVAPNLSAHEIFNVLSSSFRPIDGIGKAWSQSDEFLEDTAKSLARSFSVVAADKRLSNLF